MSKSVRVGHRLGIVLAALPLLWAAAAAAQDHDDAKLALILAALAYGIPVALGWVVSAIFE